MVNNNNADYIASWIAGAINYSKHISTLSTGSILLLVTFLDKMFPEPQWKLLIGIAFLSFMVSIIFSVLTMVIHGNLPLNSETQKIEKLMKRAGLFLVICLSAFITGLISLTMFGLINFF